MSERERWKEIQRQAEMRWMSIEDAEITLHARDVALILREYDAVVADAAAAQQRADEAQTLLRAGEGRVSEIVDDVLLARADRLETDIARQLTPLDVALTHIDILRRKSSDYSADERDNVAAIVEQHVREARSSLFAALAPAHANDGQDTESWVMATNADEGDAT